MILQFPSGDSRAPPLSAEIKINAAINGREGRRQKNNISAADASH